MLKLKRVEIQGFKSFYERTEMKFSGSGIAAVVGPNGCGKSNLSDAISWVLGEQSAKSLRGARMEDVIFAGTRERKPLSMASVTITLIPDEAVLTPIHLGRTPAAVEPEDALPHSSEAVAPEALAEEEASSESAASPIEITEVVKAAEKRGEITITRRLYRSGDSEYLINGRTARLRDIQDLFLGTGLGPESYAIIEQGRIGQILSNKPQDRRNVIEEAAGITKFKTRKRLAEARLESARQNLSRVFDILEEVTRQVNSLKRQAAKTKRYQELRVEASESLRQVLGARFGQLERDAAQLIIELNLATTELEAGQVAVAALETEQTGLLEQSYQVEHELTQLRKALSDLELEAERGRSKIEYQVRQIEQIEARLTAGGQERASLEREAETRKAELAQQAALSTELDAEANAARAQLQAKAADRQNAQNRLAEGERGLETLRQRLLKLLNESATLRNRITHAEAQLASTERDTARARTEEEQSLSDLARIQKIKTELSERLQGRQTDLISVTDRRREAEAQLGQSRLQLAGTRQSLEQLRAEHSRLKAKRDSLADVIQHRSYTTETVKRLFTRGGDFKPVGVLADFLEVDPQIEKATEEFLHEELEFVVVEEWAHAERGIGLMRGELGGRATFLVERVPEKDPAALEYPMPALEQGRLWKLTESLRLSNGLTQLPLALLPRVAQCFVTPHRELAQELAPQFPHCWFLTTDGVSYQGQAVSGGKKSGAGPLALKRELKEVSELERQKERELAAAQGAAAELERSIAALTQQLDILRGQQQAQEKDVLALDHESRKMAEELGRVQTRLSRARLELERIARDRVTLDQALARDRETLEGVDRQRHGEEDSLESARSELAAFQAAVAQASEEHASVRAGLASLEERQRSAAGQRARLEQQVRELMNRLAQGERECERLRSEETHLATSNGELELRREDLAAIIARHETEVRSGAEHESALRSRLGGLEEQLKALRAQTQAGQETRSRLQVGLARAESDLKHLEETARKELDCALAQLAEGLETMPDAEALERLESRYEEARRKIEALGPVNPQALEEFEEAQTRQEFLQVQRQDLLDSIRDTEKAISEIDGESRKRFLQSFHAINANFREMFQTLFGGGVGEMRLNDEENAADSGIDIVASPPGKKLQSVLLLSGGEKSLTAMALLMAIFQYTPSPFCILDEVDAPLDEPNIERLTRLIREMSEQTQFIVITHSKRTMEAAQSLYGVTMQEPGVSKLVSVKFNGKDAVPERGRSAKAVQVANVEVDAEAALA